jgi:CheY-like chemotaxis protein
MDRTAELPRAPLSASRIAPRRYTPALGMAVIEAPPDAGQLPSVLVIEDAVDARRIVMEQLRDLPIHVICAATGEEGLALARRHKPALILLDLVMPSMTGWEVLGRLKTDTELADIPVVVISSMSTSNHTAFLGAIDFLEKPVATDELLAVIARHLPSERRASVLVVDDNADARRIITEAITDGYSCDVAHAVDGVDAFERLQTGPVPDLIVLDLMMPRMDGFTFLAALRRDPRFAATAVIVASAKDISPAERAVLAPAAMAVMSKGEDVGRAVQDALRAHVMGAAKR